MDLGEWGEVGGVLLPFAYEGGPKRSSDRWRTRIETTDLNVPVADAVFAMPQGSAAPAPVPVAAGKPLTLVVKVAASTPVVDAGTISGLYARNIGAAAMSGRVAAVAGRTEKDGKATLFVGAASGGVWKSTDGGTTFRPVFDDQPAQSIGAIALDPSNPKIVWVGTGESWTRNSVSIGNGIYRSTDGGESFSFMGLPESERITRIVVDPRSGNVVWVCVPGKLWSDSNDRGVYKTIDGGKSWRLVLRGPNASTGCGSLDVDPKDPRVVYASLWDFRRQGWTFRSGGEGPDASSGSGVFKSVDGGATWSEITPEKNKGFAKKPYGRIGLAVAPSNPRRVYASVESTAAALYVSDDGGATWEARDKSQWMVWRPFYFQHLVVDPTNPDRLFKMNGNLIMSEDAGKSFSVVGGFTGMHGDLHDLWINPANAKQVFAGDDGGLWLSYDGGARWWKSDNLPISQFYHVAVDDTDPYNVYGGLQDNSSWVGPSEYPGGITSARWETLYWGDGFWTLPDPADARFVYAEWQGGYVARIDRVSHEARDIQPKANKGEKLRFNWNTPLALSPHEKGTLYVGAQVLFRTRDHGQSWDRISPDLTTNDPAKQQQEKSGGITVDNSAAEMHTTIYAIAESPKKKGLIWVGTDDGNVQLTQDGGKSWTNLTKNIAGLPPHSWVSRIEPSPHDAATAYVTFDRHTFGDMGAWVYVTRDAGKTWSALVTPANDKGVRGFAHVIREDGKKKGLLFLGTEYGLFISVDDGARWARFTGGRFPAVPVRDLALQQREDDLVIGTHGRGIWIIDDYSPLRALDTSTLTTSVALLPGQTPQQRISGVGGWANGAAAFVGENPTDGAVITYYQRDRHMFGPMKIEILDAAGKVVDTLPASMRRGLNRVTWSMRLAPPRVPPAVSIAGWATTGPRVLPGTYTVRITKGDVVTEQKIKVALDRRARFTEADRKAQYDAMMKIAALFEDETTLVARTNTLRTAIAERTSEGKGEAIKATLAGLDAKVDEVRKLVVATTEGGAVTGEERLREHTDTLYGALFMYEGRPGPYHLARIAALRAELDEANGKLDALLKIELPRTNEALDKAGLERLEAPPKTVLLDQVSPERAAWLRTLKRKQKKSVTVDDVPVRMWVR
ncbi:MAG: sialidase [Deltaproteobacteria bacterium]|nr:sialidase [Deltaproteobacteria bacterium]